MTKIAICGACGKMGRFIYDVISERDDCTVSAGIDKFGEIGRASCRERV